MADSLNTSFIPKQGQSKKLKQATAPRQVFIFTMISYTLIFAALLSSGAVFAYERYMTVLLNKSIAALDAEIKSFSEADMEQVIAFDSRLKYATDRSRHSLSVYSLLETLEASTINTVAISNLAIQRKSDDVVLVAASMETESFDSALFQRRELEGNKAIRSLIIEDVTSISKTAEGGDVLVPTKEGNSIDQVNFTASISFEPAAIPLAPRPPASINERSNPTPPPPPVTTASTTKVGDE